MRAPLEDVIDMFGVGAFITGARPERQSLLMNERCLLVDGDVTSPLFCSVVTVQHAASIQRFAGSTRVCNLRPPAPTNAAA
jgi:hypothetical protein